MVNFFKLNRHKMRFAFLFCLVCASVLIFFLLTVTFFTNQFPETHLLIKILLVGLIGFPLFMMALVIVLSLMRIKTNALLLKKLDALENNDLIVENALIFEDTKWYFTDYAKKITIDDTHTLIGFIHHLDNKHMRFEYKLPYDLIIKKQSITHLKNHEIEVDSYSNFVFKLYPRNKLKKMDVRHLRTELKFMVSKIKDLEI